MSGGLSDKESGKESIAVEVGVCAGAGSATLPVSASARESGASGLAGVEEEALEFAALGLSSWLDPRMASGPVMLKLVSTCFDFTSLKALINDIHKLASVYDAGARRRILGLSMFGSAAMLPVFLQVIKILSPEHLPMTVLDFSKDLDLKKQVEGLHTFINQSDFLARFLASPFSPKKSPKDSLEALINQFRLYFIFTRIRFFPEEMRRGFEHFLKDNEVFKKHPYRSELIRCLFLGFVVGTNFGASGMDLHQIGAVVSLFDTVPPRDFSLKAEFMKHFVGEGPREFMSVLHSLFLDMRNSKMEPNIFYEALEAGVRAEQLKKEKFLKLEGALKVAEKTSQLMTRKFQEAEAKVLKYKAAADAHAETQRRALETELAQLEAPAASGKKSGKSQKSKSAKVGVVASGDIPEEKEEKARASVSDSGSGLRIKRLTEQCKAEQDKAEKLAADLNAARALCEAQKEQLQVLEAKLQQNNLNKAKQAADLVRHKEELQELKAELKELKKELEQKSALIRSLEGAIRLRDFDLKEQAQVIQAMDEKLATQTLKHKKMRAAFEAALAQKKSDLAEQVFLVRQSLKAYREQSRDLGAQKREIADLKIQLERLRGENDELISGNLDLHRQYLAQFNPYQDHTAKSELVKIPMPGGGLLSVSVPPAISEACLSPRGMAHQGGAAVPVGAPSSFKTLKASAAEWVPGSTSPGGRAGGASALAFIAHPAGGAAALGSPARSWLGVVQSAQPAQFS